MVVGTRLSREQVIAAAKSADPTKIADVDRGEPYQVSAPKDAEPQTKESTGAGESPAASVSARNTTPDDAPRISPPPAPPSKETP